MADQNLPIVFLAFANDQGGGEGYLRQLRNEAEQLRDLLEQAGQVCELVVRQNASLKNILDVFQSPKYKHRIAIFHFGGHANSYHLLLESAEGKAMPANAAGLAAFLSQQRGLHLVFLNGCATGKQAQGLLAAGVQAVIATDRKIKDDVAVEFAARFYRGLIGGDTLPDAFAAAQGAVQSDIGDEVTRAYLDEEDFGDLPPDVWPWQLYPPEIPPEIAGWKLNELAGNPYWVLPPLPSGRRLPQKPFLGLSYFRENHARIFFGRGQQILELFKLITNDVSPVDEESIVNPIILLYGQSGVGKSSLLAAGLLPRLKQVAEVRYIRREEAGNNLTAALRQAVEERPSPNPSHREGDSAPPPSGGRLGGGHESPSLADRWLAQETDDRPLVIILDQAEEIYTRPNGDPKEELTAFLDNLQTIFDDDVDPWPRGKLVLGFRKEWLAEIRDRLAERELPYKEMFLKHLDRPGIIEAITGPTAQYNLVIEDEEPGEAQVSEIIADDLLADRGSAIAPTLQIILTKLWENATGKPKRFSQELYRNLRLKQANYLSQLLDQQLALMGKDHPAESASGLVLDLLAYHTTEVGTTQQRSRAELEQAYPHLPPATIKTLVKSCTNRYLLVDPSGDIDEDDHDATRLSHDTLGPLVRARFVDSQKPGQKAYRLLQNRIPDWHKGKTGPILQEEDLTIVENGLDGMRVRISEPEESEEESPEERLIQASRKARQRRRIIAGVGWGFVVVSIVAIVGLWIQSEFQRREAEQQSRLARAAQLAAQSQAAPLLQQQLLLAVEALRATQSDDPFQAAPYQAVREALGQPLGYLLRGHEGRIESVAFSPDGQWLVTGSDDDTARLWSVEEPEAEPVVLRGHEDGVGSVAFSPDGQWLVTGSRDNTARLWSVEEPEAKPVVLRGHEGWVGSVAFSPTGQWLVTGSRDDTARLWSVEEPEAEPVVLRGLEDGVRSVAFSPDGQWLVTGSNDGTARLWSVEEPEAEPVVLRGLEGGVRGVAFSPDGQWLVTEGSDGTARLWSVEEPEAEPVVLRGHEGRIESVAFSPDGQWLATGSSDGTARLWSVEEPEAEPVVLRGHEGGVYSVAFSPAGQWLVTGSSDGTARLWLVEEPEAEPMVLRGHEAGVGSVAFSPTGQWLVTGSSDGTARLWPVDEPVVLRGHEAGVGSVAFSPAGQWLVTGSDDGTARLWSVEEPEAKPVVLRGHEGRIESVAFSPDGQWLVTGSDDDTARLWSVEEPEAEPMVLRGHEGRIGSVAFSPAGQWLVTGSDDGTARLWLVEEPEAEPVVLRDHEGGVESVAFSPAGQWLVTESRDGTARLWSVEEPEAEPVVLRGLEDGVGSVAFSPDGQWLVTGSYDGTARLWSVDEPEAEPVVLRGHEAWVYSVAFSPAGQWLATGSDDGTARLWSVEEPEAEPVVLRGHEGGVESVAFSPAGQWLATGSSDGTARLWSVEEPEAEPVVLRGHKDGIRSVAFSPAGQWLATGSSDGTAGLWHMQDAFLRDLACILAGRNLTTAEWQQYFSTDAPYRPTCPTVYIPPDVITAIIQRPAAQGDFETAQARLMDAKDWLEKSGQFPQYEADFDGWLAALRQGQNPFEGE